jgi:hypothetical protein
MSKSLPVLRFALVAAALSMIPQLMPAQVDEMNVACTAKNLVDSVNVNEYTFKAYEEHTSDAFSACLEVVKAGVVVYRKVEEGGDFALGQKAETEGGIPEIANGTNVSGNGQPEMLVSYFSGGAHCCMTMEIFDLKPQLKLLLSLDAGNSDYSHFELDKATGVYDFVSREQVFAYWHTSYAESPMPLVILKPVLDARGNLNYRLDWTKMQKPAPADSVWNDDLKQAQSAFAEDAAEGDYSAGSGLWTPMLELIYSGQSEFAWKLVDAAWPKRKSGKDAFEADLCGQLTRSPFWQDLQPTLKNPPAACAKALAPTAGAKHR